MIIDRIIIYYYNIRFLKWYIKVLKFVYKNKKYVNY